MACVDFFYIVTNTVELKFHASSSILAISALLSKFLVANKKKIYFTKESLIIIAVKYQSNDLVISFIKGTVQQDFDF